MTKDVMTMAKGPSLSRRSQSATKRTSINTAGRDTRCQEGSGR